MNEINEINNEINDEIDNEVNNEVNSDADNGVTKKKTGKRIKLPKFVYKVILLAVVVIAIIVAVKIFLGRSKVKTTVITSTELEQVLQISDLATYNAAYNGIACVYNSKNKVAYYVSYESDVKLGIDMNDITVEIEDASEGEVASDGNAAAKKVIVNLPEIRIKDIIVDMASLDYMFFDKKYETEDVSSQAYSACIADVGEESRANDDIYVLARENCENVVKALINPILESQDEEYILEIRYEGDIS